MACKGSGGGGDVLSKVAGAAGLAGACVFVCVMCTSVCARVCSRSPVSSTPLVPPAAIILSRPFDLPPWLTPIINVTLQLVDGPAHVSKVAVSAFDSFWRSHRELVHGG